jgi:hypothetical protein
MEVSDILWFKFSKVPRDQDGSCSQIHEKISYSEMIVLGQALLSYQVNYLSQIVKRPGYKGTNLDKYIRSAQKNTELTADHLRPCAEARSSKLLSILDGVSASLRESSLSV